MIEPIFTRALARDEVERGDLRLPREAVEVVREHVRRHPDCHCARVGSEAREVQVVQGSGDEWWLERALPPDVAEGDVVTVHEGGEEYCLVVAVRRDGE